MRQSLGKSAKTYILDQILAEACRQLKYTTLSVADIAAQLHFDTASLKKKRTSRQNAAL